MLTQSEREWLEHRDAMQFLMGTYIADFAEFPLWNNGKDWKDAAEFSERVAAKLAKEHEEIMLNGGVCEACFAWGICFNGFEENDDARCSFEMLKAARLEVEEEMDVEG